MTSPPPGHAQLPGPAQLPGHTQPAHAEPTGTQRGPAQLPGTQPVHAEPTGTQRGPAEPTGTQRGPAEPPGTQPEPTRTQPGPAQPPGTQPGTANPAVRVEQLVVRFGQVEAVTGVTFSAAPGEVVALLGRNGAGKSTTMRVLAGVAPPTSGQVNVAGHDLVDDPVAVKRVVGYCPDQGGLLPRATPWEHLQLAASLRRLDDWEPRAQSLLDRFELAGVADRITSGFSHGMMRRLSVVLAAFHRPTVLLLDEPFDGVDPLGVTATLSEIAAASGDGATVIVSTHLRELAAEAATRALVLRGGAGVAELPAARLRGEEGQRAYRELLD